VNSYVSMLRGINVGGNRKVSMQILKEMYESIGMKNVRTYVQSGNVLFTTESSTSSTKERIQKEIKNAFGFDVLVLLRTKKELSELVQKSPFKQKDETKLHVTFLSQKPTDVPVEELNSAKTGDEDFVIASQEIYLFCPNGYGVTKLSNNFFEKKLKVSATTRNWKTVNTLLAMLSA
jgi:uncharacterized protein (DUF1697 family)